ncbi:MAG TPA: putative Ig domain-containing protein [Pyrinomonadaceae bacterium]
MKTATLFLCILLAGAFCARAFAQMNGGQYAVSQSSVSSGIGSISQGSLRIESIVGQFASGADLAADSYGLSSSFWSNLFPASPQLSLTKSAPAKAYYYSNLNGQNQPVFSFTIVATNSDATSANLTVEDVLPPGLSHVSTTITPSGSCNLDIQNKVTCTNVLLNTNESATITINVRPNGQLLDANVINTATITSVTPNVPASATVYIDDDGPSYETVYQVLPGSCNPNVLFAGLDFDTSGRAVVGWRESANCGGTDTYRWSRFENNSWTLRTVADYPGGIRGEPDLALAPDGTPFMAYAIRDAVIFGQDWYTAHVVNLSLEPNGHGANVQPIESRQSCLTTNPKFAMDFASDGTWPNYLLGTSCSFGGWLALNSAAVHGEPAFRAPAGTGGEFHKIDYASGPNGSHHLTYYAERGGPNWGAYYSNGSPGHELRLAVPHRNRAADTSIAVGANGRIHIAIGGVPLCNNTFEGGLLYLTSIDGVNWTRAFVDEVSGRGPSIALDSDGNPSIAYWRNSTQVRLASLNASAWQSTPIYSATNSIGRTSVKLAFDAANEPHVLFFNPDTSAIKVSSGLASNLSPLVTNPGSKVLEVGQNISFQLVSSDTESDALSFSACNLPAGLSIDPGTGLITGTIGGPPADYEVTITVGDVANNSTSVTFNWLTIPQGTPYRLAFIVQPTDTNIPNAISPAVKVAVQDFFGNTLNNAADSVTIALANNPGGSTLSGSLTRNAVNGVATFDDLRLDQAGTGYTLRATSGSLISATSTAFNVFIPEVVINITEQIMVADSPALLPSAVINVSENIVVDDAPALLPAAILNIIEQINVVDTPAFWPPVETPTGSDVSVQVGNVTITFQNVLTAGSTSVVPIDPASAGTLPAGLALCAGCPAYEITTTVVYSPPVKIAMTVPSVNDPVFSQLKMLHGEDDVLVDRTTGRNLEDKQVLGSVNSLSPFVIVQNASNANPTPTPTPTANAGQVIISEFRLRGPGNNSVATALSQKPLLAKASSIVSESTSAANDEFVEIYNATDSDITVSTTDESAGWALAASDGVARFVVPNGTVIPARGHFLGVNSAGYSLSASAAGDIEYTTDIPDNAGIALFRTANAADFTLDNRLDAVGPTSEANALYREGVGYRAFSAADLALNLEHSFYRSLCSFQSGVGCATPGNPRDTDENAVDFLFVDTNGALTTAGQRLGAPGPENLASPIRRDAAMPLILLDASVAAAAPPNRFRVSTSDPANASTFGTLSLPRRITNNTGAPVTRLQFRIVELTTSPASNGMADLRARSSGASFNISGINDANTCAATGTPITTPCMVTVQPTTLVQPPNQPGNVGGGQNAILGVGTITMTEPLPDGKSINVQFLLGVQRTGLFRFLIIIEALP